VPDPEEAAEARAAGVLEIRTLAELPEILTNENRRPLRESPA
jgi:hypothetical protein